MKLHNTVGWWKNNTHCICGEKGNVSYLKPGCRMQQQFKMSNYFWFCSFQIEKIISFENNHNQSYCQHIAVIITCLQPWLVMETIQSWRMNLRNQNFSGTKPQMPPFNCTRCCHVGIVFSVHQPSLAQNALHPLVSLHFCAHCPPSATFWT